MIGFSDTGVMWDDDDDSDDGSVAGADGSDEVFLPDSKATKIPNFLDTLEKLNDSDLL